jgi:hypothetical protein
MARLHIVAEYFLKVRFCKVPGPPARACRIEELLLIKVNYYDL